MSPNREEFIQIINDLKTHQQDPEWLSTSLLTLATFLIFSSEEVSQAQYEENASALKFMEKIEEGKKMSATQAEKYAIVETQSKYKQILLEREGIIETINAIKKRLDFLNLDRKMG